MAGSKLSAHKEVRARWYLQVDKYGKTVNEVCNIFGISRKTYYKWYGIDHPIWKQGKRPRKMHPQTKIFGNVRVLIAETKLAYNYGPNKMSIWLKKNHNISISHQAIYKFYKKRHLIKKPQKKLKWYLPLKQPYYAEIPRENVQVDVKYVPGPDSSWNYQYRFLDTVGNLQFAEDALIKDSQTTVYLLQKAMKYFNFKITGIQTDNGSEFRGYFHRYLIKQNITHHYIPKRSAPWNGKVERANRSVDDEYYLNPNRPWKTIIQYVNWYNHQRPHEGKHMNGLTPYEKYLSFCPQV